jgi:polysaccharide biosynthesis protein PslH
VKILFLTPQPPAPPDQGTKLRNYHLIRIATEAGHQVHLLTFTPPGPGWPGPAVAASDELEVRQTFFEGCESVQQISMPPVRPFAGRLLDLGLSNLPDLVTRLWSPAFAERLQEMLAEHRYDIVQAEGFEMGLYLRLVRGARTVFDDHNVEFELQWSAWQTDRHSPKRAPLAAYSLIQGRRLREWERRYARENDAVLAVSAQDAQVLAALSGREVRTVENGIELASRRFQPSASSAAAQLLFDGTLSFRPNDDAARWLCREIMPSIRAATPAARCWIVGRGPSARLVSFNFGDYGVAVTGEVPSVEPYWARASVYLLPMRMGGGVRFKALEAMARGLPIVSTRLGMQGTGAEPERDYLLADDAPSFAAATGRLLASPELRARLAAHARRTVAALDWGQIAPRLLRVYDKLAANRGREAAPR